MIRHTPKVTGETSHTRVAPCIVGRVRWAAKGGSRADARLEFLEPERRHVAQRDPHRGVYGCDRCGSAVTKGDALWSWTYEDQPLIELAAPLCPTCASLDSLRSFRSGSIAFQGNDCRRASAQPCVFTPPTMRTVSRRPESSRWRVSRRPGCRLWRRGSDGHRRPACLLPANRPLELMNSLCERGA